MRELLGFLVFLTIVFFVVGETVGWNVGVAGNTPVGLYKRSGSITAERATVRADSMTIGVEGRVRAGEVEVVIIYQDTGSFQSNRPPEPAETIFERTYRRGERIAIDELFDEGRGDYRVTLRFRDATGLFTVRFPQNVDL
jgi:hypothetical protein